MFCTLMCTLFVFQTRRPKRSQVGPRQINSRLYPCQMKNLGRDDCYTWRVSFSIWCKKDIMQQGSCFRISTLPSSYFPILQEGKKSDDLLLTLNHCACITGVYVSNFPPRLGFWQSHDQILHSDWTALP